MIQGEMKTFQFCFQGDLSNTFGSLNKLQELDNIAEEESTELLEKREMIRNLEEKMNDKDREMERLKQMIDEIKSIDGEYTED